MVWFHRLPWQCISLTWYSMYSSGAPFFLLWKKETNWIIIVYIRSLNWKITTKGHIKVVWLLPVDVAWQIITIHCNKLQPNEHKFLLILVHLKVSSYCNPWEFFTCHPRPRASGTNWQFWFIPYSKILDKKITMYLYLKPLSLFL